VEWLWGDLGQGNDDEQKDEDEEGIDVSQLGESDNGDNTVDSGVTSGADPSSWDPIDIENNQ
jgi:hypothetical protein